MSNRLNAHRTISSCGLRLIKKWEGLYLSAYRDPVGVLTIGYGHTNLSGVGPKVVPGMRLRDEAHASEILVDVLKKVYEPAIRRHVKVPLNQHQWDALVSWIYNLGETNFRRSTMLRRINAGRFEDVPAEMNKWNKAGGRVFRGLVNRRAAEGRMWQGVNVTHCLPVQSSKLPHKDEDLAQVHDTHDEPAPEPVTQLDSHIEKVSVLGPIVTALGAIADWKVAAVIVAAMTVGILAYLIYRNRTEDT